MKKFRLTAFLGLAVASTGCKDDEVAQTGGSTANTPSTQSGTTAAPKEGEHKRVPIGEKTVGNLKLVATMDEPVKPGGEGAFDLVITGGKPRAVRFWVGTEDAKGSVKAKDEEETTDNWHTHAEVLAPAARWGMAMMPTHRSSRHDGQPPDAKDQGRLGLAHRAG